jgi:ADP-heptose:LPS heptosyltransferase
VLAPVSRRAEKEWGPAAFAATARGLHVLTGAVFLVAGGPGEAAGVDAVASRLAGVPRNTFLARNLAELGGVMAGARLFVGNDGGPRHLADALGLPTLAYFGTRDPSPWMAPGPGPHRALWEATNGAPRPRADVALVAAEPDAAAHAAAGLLAGSGT